MSRRGMPQRRFTPEEDDIIRAEFADYIQVRATATRLGRDFGTVRQRIFYLRLKRDSAVSKMLTWCPDSLKPILKENGRDAFIDAVNRHAMQLEHNDGVAAESLSAAEQLAMDEAIAEIESSARERKEKMMAMRALGLTLQSIGDRFGISRERVRQLTDPDFTPGISMTPRTVDNLLNINEKLEAKLIANKARIKTKIVDGLITLWHSADEDTRNEFLKIIG